MTEERTRQVRVKKASLPTEENLVARRERRRRPDKVIEEVQEQPVNDVPIVGSQRVTRKDRVLGDYPNMDTNPIPEIMERMGVGETLTFVTTRFSENEWRTIAGERVPRITNPDAHEGRLPRNFEKDVILSPEFVKWSKEWNDKDNTFEKKKAFAAEHGIQWDDDHPNLQTRKMRLGYAVRCWLKIEKFRPAYSGPDGRAARKQARELAKVGPKK